MKELFEDKMTSKFREVLENYEPAYSPQAWDNLQRQLPVKVPFWKRISKWYFIIVAGLIITGICIFNDQENDNQFGSNQIKQSIPKTETLKKELAQNHLTAIKPSSNSGSVPGSGSKSNLNLNLIQPSSLQIVDNSENTESRNTLVSKERLNRLNLLTNTLHSNDQPSPKLETMGTNTLSADKNGTRKAKPRSGRIEFKLPEISFKSNGHSDYKKFIGPTQLAIFYNPEIHSTSITGKLGLSHGIGVELEGLLNSFMSVSCGVNFQSNNYSHQISREELLLQPNIRQINNIYNDNKSKFTQILDTVSNHSLNYQFVEVPVTLKLALLQTDRSKFSLTAGVSAIFFLKEKYITPFSTPEMLLFSEERTFTRFNNIHPLASFNTGISYRHQLSERFSVFTNLQYKFNLTPLGGNELKISRLSSQIGIFYRFGRKGF